MNRPRCETLVLSCIDFRLIEKLAAELAKIGITSFDLKTDAGAVKYLVSSDRPEVRDWILENVALARELHGVERVILINHSDCGAYGGNAKLGSVEAQRQLHQSELEKAKQILHSTLPGLVVETFFAVLDGGTVRLLPVEASSSGADVLPFLDSPPTGGC